MPEADLLNRPGFVRFNTEINSDQVLVDHRHITASFFQLEEKIADSYTLRDNSVEGALFANFFFVQTECYFYGYVKRNLQFTSESNLSIWFEFSLTCFRK